MCAGCLLLPTPLPRSPRAPRAECGCARRPPSRSRSSIPRACARAEHRAAASPVAVGAASRRVASRCFSGGCAGSFRRRRVRRVPRLPSGARAGGVGVRQTGSTRPAGLSSLSPRGLSPGARLLVRSVLFVLPCTRFVVVCAPVAGRRACSLEGGGHPVAARGTSAADSPPPPSLQPLPVSCIVSPPAGRVAPGAGHVVAPGALVTAVGGCRRVLSVSRRRRVCGGVAVPRNAAHFAVRRCAVQRW